MSSDAVSLHEVSVSGWDVGGVHYRRSSSALWTNPSSSSPCVPMLDATLFLRPTAVQPGLWTGGTAMFHYFLWSVCDLFPIHLLVATKPATPWVKITQCPRLLLEIMLGHLVPSWGQHWKVQLRQKPYHTCLVSPRLSYPLQLWFNCMYHTRAQARSTLMKMQGKKMLAH